MGQQSADVSIKGYEVLSTNGTLIKARHTNLDRVVALRVIEEGASQEEIDHFLQVARTLAKLHHPNIVAVSDAGTCPDSGLHYMAMEFVGDQTLSASSRRRAGARSARATRWRSPRPWPRR